MKRIKVNRRNFIKGSAFIAATATATGAGLFSAGNPELEAAPAPSEENNDGRKEFLSACPYCGVGCGTLIQVEKGKIVSMRPDPKHPTNRGLQCIKGLTAAEPLYTDRLEGDAYVRKDVWKEWNKPGHGNLEYTSKTKGSFDEKHFVRVPYEKASPMVAHKIAHLHKKHGGNSIALYGSGQLTVEGQWLENLFMKGILGSNTIEANARMCMTSAVTGYFKTLGSDTPPLCYDDLELTDMVMHFGHNARESHPIIFWRIADYKKKTDIPTVVVDPRYTGTAQGYNDINPKNSVHVPILNGDISFLNAMAHVLLKEHPDVIAWDYMKAHTDGWKEYTEGVLKDYSPEQVQNRMGSPDVTPEMIRRVSGMFADATRKRLARTSGKRKGQGGVVIMWGIGYNQHIHGQNNVISLINLLNLTGNIAKKGCGPFSMTGQPNAMGERFTGGLTGRLPFNVGLKNTKQRDRMAKVWGVPEKNLVNAMNSVNSGMAVGMMERGLKNDKTRVRAMFLVYATHIDLPDSYHVSRPAMNRMFVIAQEIYRHAPNNLYADVIFPAATWGEAQGTYIQSERRFYVTDKAAQGPKGSHADMDMVIDKGKEIGKLIGIPNVDKIFHWKKLPDGSYDAEEVFRDLVVASAGTDTDLTGMLEVEKRDGIGLYDQIRELRGIQWPAPTYAIARAGGAKRRYMDQIKGWKDKPYGDFRTKDGKAHFVLCQQDYSKRKEVTDRLMQFGVKKGFYTIDHRDLLIEARNMALTPDLPDMEFRGIHWADIPKNKYPFWMAFGVVYEHFHTAKCNRSPTLRRLVPEMYVEMHEDDANELGIKDGDLVRLTTRRGHIENVRAQVGGTNSLIAPARNFVPRGFFFSPWNLSVVDSADPRFNHWLVNGTTNRAYDPVSGQVDFKKSACRIEKI